MNTDLTATLDGIPILEATLTHRAGLRSTTLDVRVASRDLARFKQRSALRLSDGVHSVEAFGLIREASRDNFDASHTLRYRLPDVAFSAADLRDAAERGEALVAGLQGGVAIAPNNQSHLVRDDAITLAWQEATLAKPEALVVRAASSLLAHDLPDEWQTICQDEQGRWQALDALLAEWGIDEAHFNDVILHPEDLREALQLSPARAALLARFAYRAFRFTGEEPTGRAFEVLSSGHDAFEFSRRPNRGPIISQGQMHPVIAMLDQDADARPVIIFASMAAELAHKGGEDRFTPHGFVVKDRAKIEATLGLEVDTPAEVTRIALNGNGPELALELALPPTLAGSDARAAQAQWLHDALSDAFEWLPSRLVNARFAGPVATLPTLFSEVIYRAGPAGMTTETVAQADFSAALADMLPRLATPAASVFTACEHTVPKPQNAWRGGPIILRDDADSKEDLAFAALESIAPTSGALNLERFGRIAQPFWVAGAGPDDEGAWVLAAPIKLMDQGVALLEDELGPDASKESLDAKALGDETPVPRGSDGVILQGLDGQTALALYDRALVSDMRGLGLV
ncbi:MAG: hypothetical protein KDB07_09505, partial [Planctomycetes bacterium]|nr:hypothetical protein [Planctomycetota bacterium]